MQRSTSTYTTVLLMVMDFLEATLSLHDIDHILKNMSHILADAKERIHLAQSHERPSPITDSPGLMNLAMLIWEKDNSVIESSAIRVSSHIKKRNSKPFKSVYPAASNGSVESFDNSWSAKVGELLRVKVSDVRLPNQRDASGSDKTKTKYSGDPPASSYAKEIVDEMSKSERLRYLQYALQVLHIAEFLVLVELTEVIIPMVYCRFSPPFTAKKAPN
jgi:hypothetical protein